VTVGDATIDDGGDQRLIDAEVTMEPDTKIREILCDLLSCDTEDITDDSFLSDDLGMTPDDLEELVVVLKDEFEIDIPTSMRDWETVADVVNYILEKFEDA
jgi:acyl carrier protein